MVCMCATMYRIDLPHLAWTLDNIARGTPVNIVKVPEETAGWARVALPADARGQLTSPDRGRPTMSTTGRASNPGFWRCARCNTPNPWASYLTCCIGCGAPRPAPGQATTVGEGVAAPRRRVGSRWLLGSVVGFGAILMLALGLERLVGDGWWPGTVLLLSPRWAFLVPVVPLATWAVLARRWRIAAAVGLEALFVAGPLMGFNVPWGRLVARAEGPRVRIMTLNRGSVRLDAGRFGRYIDRQKIDVVCFQDFGNDPAREIDPALATVLAERGWHRDSSRMIASRFPIEAELPRPPEHNLAGDLYTMTIVRVRVVGPDGLKFVVASVHMPTLRPGFRKLFGGDVDAFRRHSEWWSGECGRLFEVVADSGGGPALVAGDFNHSSGASVLATVRARGLFRSAFEEAGFGWGYTRPTALPWVRIDHILAGPDWSATACWVGPDFGSDHRSLVAEVALPARP